jgi:phosphomannomutase
MREKDIVLLDMDGTLTPPRGAMEDEVAQALTELHHLSDIAIVSGSSLEYMLEQCDGRLSSYSLTKHIKMLPCNGTQVYSQQGHDNLWIKEYAVNMEKRLGRVGYRRLISSILKAQSVFLEFIESEDINLIISGNFISYRGSTVNWSMIGRDNIKLFVSNSSLWGDGERLRRLLFSSNKRNRSIRMACIDFLKDILPDDLESELDFALGGQTSIDIYPKGWDKTYALGHYPDHKSWFVGDKCEPGENDYHIYKEVSKSGRAFKTSGPEETIEIIDVIIKNLREEYDR